jgi:hypothetical protein
MLHETLNCPGGQVAFLVERFSVLYAEVTQAYSLAGRLAALAAVVATNMTARVNAATANVRDSSRPMEDPIVAPFWVPIP